MNKIIIAALVLSGMTANAQVKNGMVGINTDEPRATMHIEPGVSESKGLIIPRITAAQMKTMTSLAHFGADHHAIITYLKEQLPVADRIGKLVDVAEPGYYYYDNTTGVQKWKTFGGGAEQDLRYINGNHLTKDAGIGGNGTSLGSSWGNIAIGPNTFYGFTNPADLLGGRNIAMGSDIYYNNGGTMQASGNTGIGYSLFSMGNGGTLQGINNVALGNSIYNLSKANAQFTGYSNFGIGQSLFYLNNGDLTGYNNFGIGQNLFNLNNGDLTGNNNMGIGLNQFSPNNGNITGSDNMGIGNSSLYTYNGNITGANNMGIGGASISVHTGNLGGTGNMGIGSSSISVHNGDLTGINNMGIGTTSIYINGNFSGHNNLAFGNSAMNSHGDFTGNNNIAIGQSALRGGASGITGSNNVAIGHAGYYNLGEGNGNIAILSGNGIDTPGVMDNAIIIGNASWGSLQDGTVAIGNSAYGTPILLGSSGNKVGVGGVTTPQTALDVSGAIKVGNEYFACDTYQHHGIIRFDGVNFYGCTPSGWKQLNN